MNLCKIIILKLYECRLIMGYDIEFYAYGLYILLINLLSVIAVVISGLINKSIIEGLIFLVIFNTLRTKSGGFHLDNDILCYIISLTYLLFVPYLVNYIKLHYNMIGIIFVSTAILIASISPIDTKTRRLSSTAKHRLKIKVLYSLLVIGFLFLIFIKLGLYTYLIATLLSLTTTTILLFLCIYDNFKERHSKNEVDV